MKISIITPSYKQLRWLKLCAASVADQKGVSVEHIIQDAQTGKELEDWVHSHSNAQLFVESDSGMYDAISRGFARATGDIVAWLNCDEQYLPGALARVAAYFERHPEVDVLFGDAVLLNEDGELLSYRRAILPSFLHVQLSHLNTLSCATFVRRSVIERGLLLKTEWKAIADAVWVADMLKAKLHMAVLPEPLAAFTMTEENLGQSSLAFKESERWQNQSTTALLRALRGPVVFWHRIRKLLNGAYTVRNFTTYIYTHSSSLARVSVSAQRLSFVWTSAVPKNNVSLLRKTLDELGRALLPQPQGVKAMSSPFASYQPPRWPLVYSVISPLLLAAVVLYLEIITPDVLVAPFLTTILMLLLSLRLEPLHLVLFAATFQGVVFYSIRYLQPFDLSTDEDWMRLGLRCSGFLVVSVLAILFSKYRCKAKRLQDQTLEVIVSMPVPVVISDALGLVIFANDEASDFLQAPREQLQGANYIQLFMGHLDEGTAMRDYIALFQADEEAMGNSTYSLSLAKSGGGLQPVESRLICLGHGEARHMVTVLKL